MKTVRLQQLLDSITARAGIDPNLPENARRGALVMDYVQEAVNYAWTFFDWPEINHIEERIVLGAGFAEGGYTYESDYSGTISYIGRAIEGSTFDQAVWRIKRVTTNAAGAALNIDTALNVAWNNRLTATYVEDSQNSPSTEIPYVLLYSEGRTPIGSVSAVYASNPDTSLAYSLKFSVTEDRLLITDTTYTGGNVYISFTEPVPEFTIASYDAKTAYALGDLVYHNPTGDCYRATLATVGNAPTNTGYWSKQVIPFFLSDYIKTSGLASIMLEEPGMENKANYLTARAEGQLLKAMDDAWLRKGEVRRYSASFQ
jgi:hypothetical protein